MAVEGSGNGKAAELAGAMHENPEFSAKVVFQLALQGDDAARQIFRSVGRWLGLLFGDLVNIFNFPMYVIGGGVASAWEVFAPAMFEELLVRSYIYKATAPSRNVRGVEGARVPDDVLPLRTTTIITQALLGIDAGLIG